MRRRSARTLSRALREVEAWEGRAAALTTACDATILPEDAKAPEKWRDDEELFPPDLDDEDEDRVYLERPPLEPYSRFWSLPTEPSPKFDQFAPRGPSPFPDEDDEVPEMMVPPAWAAYDVLQKRAMLAAALCMLRKVCGAHCGVRGLARPAGPSDSARAGGASW